MASDLQLKTTQFNTLAFDIRIDNQDFFRGKTLSKVFKIGRSEDNLPMIFFPKGNVPQDIQDRLTVAFKSVFV